MEHLTLEAGVLALLGMVIHILMKVADKGNTEKWSLKVWAKDSMNWIRLILAIASTVAIMIMSDDVAKVMGITVEDGAIATRILPFLAGYFNHSLIRNILKVFKKRIKESTGE